MEEAGLALRNHSICCQLPTVEACIMTIARATSVTLFPLRRCVLGMDRLQTGDAIHNVDWLQRRVRQVFGEVVVDFLDVGDCPGG